MDDGRRIAEFYRLIFCRVENWSNFIASEMEKPNRNRILLLYNILTSKVFYHSVIWLGLFIFLAMIGRPSENIILFLCTELLQIGCFMIIVYINIYYLVPKFLAKNKYFIYFTYLISLTILVTLLRVTIQYWILSGQPRLQYELIYKDQFFIFLLHLFIGIAATAFLLSTSWVQSEREKKEIKSQQIESELKFLKSQINPHFLFNILNSLYALTLKKSDEAPELVIKLSEMMRYMLYDCNEKEVELEKEIRYVQNYFDLERIRIGNKVNIQLSVEGDPEDKLISPLIFVNFIENSFKHGSKPGQDKNAFIDLKISITDLMIHFLLINSKSPVSASDNKSKFVRGGIGIKNVRERLQLLYPGTHTLNIINDNITYTVDLIINLSSHKKPIL
jgi:sensor histidine kinase YesM